MSTLAKTSWSLLHHPLTTTHVLMHVLYRVMTSSFLDA